MAQFDIHLLKAKNQPGSIMSPGLIWPIGCQATNWLPLYAYESFSTTINLVGKQRRAYFEPHKVAM